VKGGWRKLLNEELRKSYSLPSKIRTMRSLRVRWAGHVARTGAKTSAYRFYVSKTGIEATRNTDEYVDG
jgi:hypothetical protein